MKKIIFYTFICFINLATNPLFAMDECKENTSQCSYSGTRGLEGNAETIIKAAVDEAVGNDQAPITLDVQEFEDRSGYCNSVRRVIGIDRPLALPKNSDALAYTAFHEAGHLLDKVHQKIIFRHIVCTILGGLLPIITESLTVKTGLFGCLGGGLAFGILGKHYCMRQAELRADKWATKRLLELKKYTAITYALKYRLTPIALGHKQGDTNHPTYQKEYNNILKTIRKQGYDVQLIYDQEHINKLRKLNNWHFTPLTILCLLKNNKPVAYDASEIKLAEIKVKTL